MPVTLHRYNGKLTMACKMGSSNFIYPPKGRKNFCPRSWRLELAFLDLGITPVGFKSRVFFVMPTTTEAAAILKEEFKGQEKEGKGMK